MTTFLASYVTPAAAIYLVNLALASVLIASSGCLAMALFRRRSAPFRHAILVSILVLTLLAPGLVWCACRSGWGQIAISLAEPAAKRSLPSVDATPAKDPAVKTRPDNLPPDAALPALPFALHPSQKASHEDPRAIASVPAVPPASTSLPEELPASPATARSWRLFAIALAAWGWLLGTLIGAAWVVRGFLVLRRFRRSLEVPSLAQLEQASREAAKAFGMDRLPRIWVSARAPAPLSLGLLHAIIVLPKELAEQSDAEQLRAILVHEAAHLAHHHHWIGLAQWLAGILFWWNPLLHRVNRGILQLREEICDDHVLQSHSDGREFARVLVDLAARLTDLPRVPATLAILETGYSDFQHRITNLLDKERIIVTHMTRKAMFLVALFGLAIALAVPFAGLRAEEKSSAANSVTKPVSTAEPLEASAGTDRKPTTDAASKQSAPKDKGVSVEAKAASAKTTGDTPQPVPSAHFVAKVPPEAADDGHSANYMERLQRYSAIWCAKSVQKELHLTDQQKEPLTALARTPQPAWSPQGRTEAAQKSYRRLQAILLPKQLDRAREIAMQFEGALAFFDADVIEALEITGDERSKMQAVLAHPLQLSKEQEQALAERLNKALERTGGGRSGTQAVLSDQGHLSKEQERTRQEQINAAFSKDQAAMCELQTAVQKTMLDEFLKVLSREQRAKYENLIGEKIDTARLYKEIMDASLNEHQIEFAETEPLANDMERVERFSILWRVESGQRELHWTDQQEKQLNNEKPHDSEPYLTAPKERAAQIQRGYQRLQAILRPEQLDRAKEMALQMEGATAFFDADVIKALKLTDGQRSEMRATYRELKSAALNALRWENPEVFDDPRRLSNEQKQALLEKGNALEKTLLDKFLNMLSREQRAKYEGMIGRKIDTAKLTKEIVDIEYKESPVVVAPKTEGTSLVYSPSGQTQYYPSPENVNPAGAPAAAPQPIHPYIGGEAVQPAEAAAAMKVLRARPPAEEKDRIAAALAVIRSCDMGEESGYPAENALRELIRIGKPAVPRLIEELDRTESNKLLRALGFVLRGIGDPRAVPALIRAIPRLAQPVGSDCGYTIKNDPELLKFMQENDNTREYLREFPEMRAEVEKFPGQATEFFYGRPINEIMPALQKITGESHRWKELVFAQAGDSAEQNRLKRLEFQKLAARWAEWWEKNWQKFVKDEGEAQLEPTRRALAKNAEALAKLAPQPLMEIPRGKNVDLGGRASFPFIVSFDDPRMTYRMESCIDVDTVRMPLAPQGLVKTSSPGTPSPELLSWAEKEGVHLIGMKLKPLGSEKSYFALQPVSLKVWRIDNSRYDHLAKELQTVEKFDLPGLWEGPIASLDEKTGQIDEHHPASFLFITKRGICGAIRVQSKETYSMPKEGTPASATGSPFELQFIYRNDKGQ